MKKIVAKVILWTVLILFAAAQFTKTYMEHGAIIAIAAFSILGAISWSFYEVVIKDEE